MDKIHFDYTARTFNVAKEKNEPTVIKPRQMVKGEIYEWMVISNKNKKPSEIAPYIASVLKEVHPKKIWFTFLQDLRCVQQGGVCVLGDLKDRVVPIRISFNGPQLPIHDAKSSSGAVACFLRIVHSAFFDTHTLDWGKFMEAVKKLGSLTEVSPGALCDALCDFFKVQQPIFFLCVEIPSAFEMCLTLPNPSSAKTAFGC